VDYIILIGVSFAAGYFLEKWFGHAMAALALIASVLPLLALIHRYTPWLIEDLFEPAECKGINVTRACHHALSERALADQPSFWLIGALVVGPALAGLAARTWLRGDE
jgi:hypothetical protein